MKKYATSAICGEVGSFQAATVSTSFHFLSSTNEMNESLSRAPRYTRNWPSLMLEIRKGLD